MMGMCDDIVDRVTEFWLRLGNEDGLLFMVSIALDRKSRNFTGLVGLRDYNGRWLGAMGA